MWFDVDMIAVGGLQALSSSRLRCKACIPEGRAVGLLANHDPTALRHLGN